MRQHHNFGPQHLGPLAPGEGPWVYKRLTDGALVEVRWNDAGTAQEARQIVTEAGYTLYALPLEGPLDDRFLAPLTREEIVELEEGIRRCGQCGAQLADMGSVRRELCRDCALPVLVARVRRLLAARPRKATLCLRVIEASGWPRSYADRVIAAADIARVRIGGRWHWSLPQHQALGGDEFHRELVALLDAEGGGSTRR